MKTVISGQTPYQIVYHGTSHKYASNIRAHGMKLGRKQMGATELFHRATGRMDDHSKQYHYLTSSIQEAAKYAKIHEDPCILRLICPTHLLQHDPEAASASAFRVKQDLSRHLVLPSEAVKVTDKKVRKIHKKLKLNIQEHALRQAIVAHLDAREDDQQYIDQARNPVQEEQAATQEIFKRLLAQGIDPSTLQEGCIITF